MSHAIFGTNLHEQNTHPFTENPHLTGPRAFYRATLTPSHSLNAKEVLLSAPDLRGDTEPRAHAGISAGHVITNINAVLKLGSTADVCQHFFN